MGGIPQKLTNSRQTISYYSWRHRASLRNQGTATVPNALCHIPLSSLVATYTKNVHRELFSNLAHGTDFKTGDNVNLSYQGYATVVHPLSRLMLTFA